MIVLLKKHKSVNYQHYNEHYEHRSVLFNDLMLINQLLWCILTLQKMTIRLTSVI